MIYSPKSVYLLYLWDLFCRIQQSVSASNFISSYYMWRIGDIPVSKYVGHWLCGGRCIWTSSISCCSVNTQCSTLVSWGHMCICPNVKTHRVLLKGHYEVATDSTKWYKTTVHYMTELSKAVTMTTWFVFPPNSRDKRICAPLVQVVLRWDAELIWRTLQTSVKMSKKTFLRTMLVHSFTYVELLLKLLKEGWKKGRKKMTSVLTKCGYNKPQVKMELAH